MAEDSGLGVLIADALAKDSSFVCAQLLKTGAFPAEDVGEFTCQRLLGVLFADMLKTRKPKEIFEELVSLNTRATLCGKVFGNGEAVYVCTECGADPTCVLCMNCFRHSAHKNHKYKMSSSGGGGCCDCGDPEAWKSDYACSLHAPTSQEAEDPNASITKLHTSLQARGHEFFKELLATVVRILTYDGPKVKWAKTSAAQQYFGAPQGSAVVVLYNDEVHSFDEVIRQLIKALKCSAGDGRKWANQVDSEGRAVVFCGEQAKAERVASVLQEIELNAVVVDAAVFAHEAVSIRILKWMASLAKVSDGLRRVIGYAIVGTVETLPPPWPITDADKPSYLETILQFYHTLWKDARLGVRTMVFSSIMLEMDLKKALAVTFTKAYTAIQAARAGDDHDDGEAITNLSVQLYTVPSIAQMLHQKYDVLGHIFAFLLPQFEAVKDALGFLNCELPPDVFESIEYFHPLYDIKYILKSGVGSLIQTLPKFLDLISLLQGMDPMKRQTGEHVEQESEGWMRAFSMSANIMIAIEHLLVSGITQTPEDVKKAVKIISERILSHPTATSAADTQTVCKNGRRSIVFDVSSEILSFHVPLHRLLAHVLEMASVRGMSLEDTFSETNVPGFDRTGLVLALLDPILRVRVLVAQIQANMWVLNGYSALNQSLNYTTPFCRPQMADLDLAMLQEAAVLLGPDHFISVVRHRFQLEDWFAPSFVQKAKDVDDDQNRKTLRLVSDFLENLVHVYSERYQEGVGQVDLKDIIRYEIIQILFACGPLPFSQIEKKVNKWLAKQSEFDTILREVSDIKAPEYMNHMMFSLKAEWNRHYNYLFYHFAPKDRSAAEIKARTLASTSNIFHGPPAPPAPMPTFQALTALPTSTEMLGTLLTVLCRAAGGWNPTPGAAAAAATSAAATASSESAPAGEWDKSNSQASLVNENVVLAALHFIIVALREESEGRVQGFSDLLDSFRSQGVSILEALVHLLSIDTWRDPSGKSCFQDHVNTIFSVMKNVGSDALRDRLFSLGVAKDEGLSSSASEEQRKRKKATAAARREALMRKFSSMQTTFSEENEGLLSSDPSPSKTPSSSSASAPRNGEKKPRNSAYEDAEAAKEHGEAGGAASASSSSSSAKSAVETFTCLNCQEEVCIASATSTFVLFGIVQESCIVEQPKSMDMDDEKAVLVPKKCKCDLEDDALTAMPSEGDEDGAAAAGTEGASPSKEPAKVQPAPPSGAQSTSPGSILGKIFGKFKSKPKEDELSAQWKGLLTERLDSGSGVFVGSCGHGMHLECWRRFFDSAMKNAHQRLLFFEEVLSGEFRCPLCRDLCNVVIPVIPTLSIEREQKGASSSQQDLKADPAQLHIDLEHVQAASRAPHPFLTSTPLVIKGAGVSFLLTQLIRNADSGRCHLPSLPNLVGEPALGTALYLPARLMARIAEQEDGFPVNAAPFVWTSVAYTASSLAKIAEGQTDRSLSLASVRMLRALCGYAQAVNINLMDDRFVLQREVLIRGVFPPRDLPDVALMECESFGTFVRLFLALGGSGFDGLARVMYVQSIVRALVASACASQEGVLAMDTTEWSPEDLAAAACLRSFASKYLPETFLSLDNAELLSRVHTASQAFLRRALLLRHALTYFGEEQFSMPKTAGEVCAVFSLPKFSDVVAVITGVSKAPPATAESPLYSWSELAAAWLSQGQEALEARVSSPIAPEELVFPRLIRLPHQFNDLFHAASLVTCAKTLKPPSLTALCLLCGEFVCVQSECCRREDVIHGKSVHLGGCSSHAYDNSSGLGLFFIVRQNAILVLHNGRGSFFPSPYLDEHGEPDSGLARGLPLFLHSGRYRHLELIWQSHGILQEIGRYHEKGQVSRIANWNAL